MKIQSNKITQNLALNAILLQTAANVVVPKGVNHIYACDVSGSMSYDLRQMRTQLKNRIPDIVGTEDTITIIWFSGRGQAGVLKEGVQVKNLVDLQALNDAIDRFLVPVGLTAFLPPIELVDKVIANLGSNGKDFAFSFLSDGYNNDSTWSQVITALEKLDSKLAAATFIEYGYYADSAALTQMAETVGGEKIFAKDFDSYQQAFEQIMGKKTSSKRSIDITSIKDRLTYQFFYSIDAESKSVNVYSCKGKDEILVPEHLTELYFLTQYKPKEAEEVDFTTMEVLTAAYILSDRLKYKHVEDILVKLGDVKLINQFSGAYGKQKLNELKDDLKDVSFGDAPLFVEGKQEGYKINPKQYCVMDLINDLQNGENYFFPYHEDFNYNRIGVKKTTKVELDAAAQEALAKAKTLKETQKALENIEAPEFIYPDNAGEIPMSFDTLVWNSERANLSVQTTLFGKVKLPKNNFGLTEVDSRIHRNYTFIKDGVLNITEIPVRLDEATYDKLFEKGLIVKGYTNDIHILNIASLPIINRSMTTNVSGKKLAQLEFELLKVQLGHKYLKNLKEQYDPKTNADSAAKFTPEAAEWLKSIGVTDYNGFSPKTESDPTGDVYMAPVLETKIEKTSTSPKVADVLKKVEALVKQEPKAKELNLMESMMKSEIDEINPKVGVETTVNVTALNEQTKDFDRQRRQLLFEIAVIKFGVILSRTWFTEFENMDQNELDLTFKGAPNSLKVKFDFKDKEIKL